MKKGQGNGSVDKGTRAKADTRSLPRGPCGRGRTESYKLSSEQRGGGGEGGERGKERGRKREYSFSLKKVYRLTAAKGKQGKKT